ncbi:hypothetical protein H4S08_001759 [Coemansia sp. RSA 1365]|nr:hypothetical protein H4S08_001759 [Coemansia sp. RSA 1365]
MTDFAYEVKMTCRGCSNAVDKALTKAGLLHEVVFDDQLVVVRVEEPLDKEAVEKKREEILTIIRKTGKLTEVLNNSKIKEEVLKSLDAKAAEKAAKVTSDQPAKA